jgi:DNA-binding NarL/FixJ family response regulator
MTATIRIGLLDSEEDVRFGRRLLLSSLPGAEVVFDSAGMLSDFELIQESLIDVLVIDQKLNSGPGIDFYSSLRKLSGPKQTPVAILTASFVQPALLLEALGAGIFDVVAVEQGAEHLVETLTRANSHTNPYSLAEISQLLASQPRNRQIDLNFVNQVDQLPEKLASNLRRIKSLWRTADMAKLEHYDLNSLNDVVSRLPVANATELVIALNRSVLLDE